MIRYSKFSELPANKTTVNNRNKNIVAFTISKPKHDFPKFIQNSTDLTSLLLQQLPCKQMGHLL